MALDCHNLTEPEHQIRAVCTKDGKLADERRYVPCDLGVARHQEFDDDVDIGPAVLGGSSAHELEAPQIVPLKVAVLLEGFDEPGVFADAQGETQVRVRGAIFGISASPSSNQETAPPMIANLPSKLTRIWPISMSADLTTAVVRSSQSPAAWNILTTMESTSRPNGRRFPGPGRCRSTDQGR